MIATDVQKLAAGNVIDLFEIDNTAIGGTVLRWVDDVNELNADIIWQGNTYSRFPIEAKGFSTSGKGTQPRPTIKASNVSGAVGALTRSLQDLIGAKFTRRRTFVKYLDAANFASGNAQADPNVHFGLLTERYLKTVFLLNLNYHRQWTYLEQCYLKDRSRKKFALGNIEVLSAVMLEAQ